METLAQKMQVPVIDSKAQRVESLRIKPLRPNNGAPVVGKNAAKPFKIPDGRIMTVPMKVSLAKPLKGLR